eukprot:Phypoly_transcript_13316.p1 GENE.Phypoly_transcript_13316~~Phypoly_transcript_13316.p1  ORF type:complete len:261 (+),score=51.68 Phypoly_transcript_13316:112-894(+)
MTALAIVTGASRGIGRAIAIEAAKSLSLSRLVLLSRSKEGLEETNATVLSSHPSLNSSVHVVDFSDLDRLENNLKSLFKELDPAKYKKIYLFANHAVLDPIAPLRDLKDFARVRKDIDTNVTSVIYLTTLFLQHFSPSSLTSPPHLFLVNISSLAAIQAFAAWGIYCSGKAARDLLYACVAKEEDAKYVKVLNYAPGPCDTDMQKQVRETTGHAPTNEFYTNLHKEGKLVNVHDSVQKLIKIITENKFETGAHIDYYDNI